MNKSEHLIPLIQKAKTEAEAINVLNSVVDALHLSQNFFHLLELKNKMEEYKVKFKVITDQYHQIPIPRMYAELHALRIELGFLSRDFVDDLSYECNRVKIFHEERKTEARAAGMLEIKESKEFQERMKATSASALRDLVGGSGVYQEYISLVSVSYGLYQEFHKVSDSMKMFSDGMASECREAQHVEHKDVK